MPLIAGISGNFSGFPALAIDFTNGCEIQYFVGGMTEEILFVGQGNKE